MELNIKLELVSKEITFVIKQVIDLPAGIAIPFFINYYLIVLILLVLITLYYSLNKYVLYLNDFATFK